MFYRNYGKRLMDFILSLIAITVFSPLFVIVAILIKIKLGGKVIFKQRRPGLNGKVFMMYKFRTMTNDKDSNGELLPNEQRHTKFGKTLRKTSLDELPELFNILKGDMSIIGPRPLLVEYLSFYSTDQKKRHDVRPGLSGLAQVNGRNAISWKNKFSYDIQYIRKITFLEDIKIILMTIKKVFKRENINSSVNMTMEKFNGKN